LLGNRSPLKLRRRRLDSRRARDEYKAVWTAAATSAEQARIAVAGEMSEASFWDGGAANRDVLLRTVGINPEDVVLEIGCGVGRVGRSVAPLCREWIGCDVSPPMLNLARTYLADLQNVRLVETSGFDLGAIASESVDVVYCTVVFMHLDEWTGTRTLRRECACSDPAAESTWTTSTCAQMRAGRCSSSIGQSRPRIGLRACRSRQRRRNLRRTFGAPDSTQHQWRRIRGTPGFARSAGNLGEQTGLGESAYKRLSQLPRRRPSTHSWRCDPRERATAPDACGRSEQFRASARGSGA
jgi:SAM-dependent methyltransferase